MPNEGQTALAIPVPEAAALLASVAARFPAVVREGVPPHVSVQYPFVAAGEFDDSMNSALVELFGAQQPMSVTFAECGRRGGFVYLRPDPLDWLAALTSNVRQRWPQVILPDRYDGDVGPHVTVAMRASEQDADIIEREALAALPISAQLREVWLLVFDGRWVVRGRFEFGIEH